MDMKSRVCATGLLILLAFAHPAVALDNRWSVSFSLGGLSPGLSALDKGLYQAPLTGTATVLLEEGVEIGEGAADEDVNITETIPFRFDNPLSPVRLAPFGGIEFTWHASERHAFIVGFAAMEHSSISNTRANLPLQQYFVLNDVESQRRGKIGYTEYNFGYRYNFLQRDNFRSYLRLTLHEIFNIRFREDFTFLFVDSPIEDLIDVRRNMVVEAGTSPLLTAQIGLGSEWFINEWFSLGMEGGYMIGERDFSLRDIRIRDDFVGGDNVSRTGMPFRRMPDGTLGFLSPGATPDDLADPATRDDFYTPIRLGFDGWRVQFRVNFYF